MTEFNPFLDLSSKTDEDLLNDLTRIYAMISFYQRSGNYMLINQLQNFKNSCINEMNLRSDKKQQDKENSVNPVVIDTEKVYIEPKHRQIL
jgi:hypothetical protein